MRWVVYEVWTKARIIEADDIDEANVIGEPKPRNDDLNLSNWHVIKIPDVKRRT